MNQKNKNDRLITFQEFKDLFLPNIDLQDYPTNLRRRRSVKDEPIAQQVVRSVKKEIQAIKVN